MADWAIYWKYYRSESGADGEPVTGWVTDRERLVDSVEPGDRIWLFIAGDACGDKEHHYRAYLAQLLVVEGSGYHPEYEPGDTDCPHYQIDGIDDRCILISPPALVDDILRKANGKPLQHIGIARQTPFQLEGGEVTRILDLLKRQYHAVYLAAVGPDGRS